MSNSDLPPGRPAALPHPALGPALALLAGCALYAPNLRLQLLADDFAFLNGAQSMPLWRWLGTTAGVSYYRPFSRQLYVEAMSRLFGTHPLPYHAVNLALLLLAAWLLARLATRLASPAAGAVAATLFLAQHGASVLTGWAACAQDLFAVTLTAATLLLQMSGRTALGLVACAAALLSKETAALAPPLVLLTEWLRPGRGLRPALRAAAPYLALLAAWALAYALWFRHFPGAPPVGVLDVKADAAGLLRVLSRSLLALVNLDTGLAMPRPWPDLARALVAAALGVAAILAGARGAGPRRTLAATAAVDDGRRAPTGRAARRRSRPQGPRHAWAPSQLSTLGAAWLLLGLLPVLLVGHRWSTYLTVMMAAGSSLLAAAALHRHTRAAAVAAGLLLLAGPASDAVTGGPFEQGSTSVWSLPRVRRLSDFVNGFQRALMGRNPRLAGGTAVLLSRMPNMSLVALHGSNAVRAWYADTSLVFDSIEILKSGHTPERMVVLDCDPTTEPYRWAQESPEFVRLRVEIKRALDAQRADLAAPLLDQARRAPEWALLSETWRAGALLTLGQACQRIQRMSEAEAAYRESLRLDPQQAATWFGLGAVLAIRRQYPESEPLLGEAARREPENALYQFTYGALLRQNGRDPSEAAAHLRRALQLGLEEPSRSAAVRVLQEMEAQGR